MLRERFLEIGEYGAAGMYEEPDRSLFYRKALGIRRYYENCSLLEYQGKPLYPSGRMVYSMCIRPNYLYGMTVVERDQMRQKSGELMECFLQEFDKYKSSIPRIHTVAGNMWTHSMPNYERICGEGLLSYIPRIQKIQDRDMREGLLHVVEGIHVYAERCAAYLESVSADPKLVDALKKVPMHPAQTLYEALVCWNFVLYLDNCDNLGCVASGLYPYYKGEDVTEMLENLFDNLDACNGYTMALGTDYNPLTLQCLEASKGKRRPMIELFVDENTPEEVWEKAFEVIRTANGQPAFYNPHVLLEGLQKKFPNISDTDIRKFCGGGCTESMLAGLSNVGSLDAGLNMPYILEEVIHKELERAESFDAFYDSFLKAVKKAVDDVTREISNSQKERAKYDPLPMRTLLIDDCIDRGVEFNQGGARYCWSIITFAGLINVIDGLLVIRDMVFADKIMTPGEMIEKLDANDEEFLKKCRNHRVSFGNDNADANAFAGKLSADVYSMLDEPMPYLGGGFLPCSIQFMAQAVHGKIVGATPDGRAKNAPLADSLAAVFGKDTKGPTALLKSVTLLNLERALGTPVLNFNLNPDFSNATLRALILGYMKLGGVQMQITCISRELLEEAYKNPELHKNLVVRVGGYSEYFYKLSDDLKRMVIERTIQK